MAEWWRGGDHAIHTDMPLSPTVDCPLQPRGRAGALAPPSARGARGAQGGGLAGALLRLRASLERKRATLAAEQQRGGIDTLMVRGGAEGGRLKGREGRRGVRAMVQGKQSLPDNAHATPPSTIKPGLRGRIPGD